MGFEVGATTEIFPYDEKMDAYLRATERAPVADLAKKNRDLLEADPEVEADPGRFFERVVEIDPSALEPQMVGPHTPDLARPVSALREAIGQHGYPESISVALIGSCTNSSYEDITRAADVALQAKAHGARMVVPLLVTPGSDQIDQTIRRDGQMAALEAVGAPLLANAYGPFIAQRPRPGMNKGHPNTTSTPFHRNFPGRKDPNPETLAFLGSPQAGSAYGLSRKPR